MANTRGFNVRELVKMMLLWRNVSLSALAKHLNSEFGYSTSQSNLSRKLINETIKWKEVQDIATLLGYKIKFEEAPDWKGLKKKKV